MNEINESLIAETFCSVRNKYHKRVKKIHSLLQNFFHFPFARVLMSFKK